MSATQEEILYQFNADTSKLKPGIDRAIGMLDKLKAKTKSLNSMKKSTNGMAFVDKNIGSLKGGVSDLTKLMNSMKVPKSMAGAFINVQKPVEQLRGTMSMLNKDNIGSVASSNAAKALTNAVNYLMYAFQALEREEYKTQAGSNAIVYCFNEAAKAATTANNVFTKTASTYSAAGSASAKLSEATKSATANVHALKSPTENAAAAARIFEQANRASASATDESSSANKQNQETLVGVKDILDEGSDASSGYANNLNTIVNAAKSVNNGISGVIGKAAELEKRMLQSVASFQMFGNAGQLIRGTLDAMSDAFTAVSGVAVGSVLEESIQKSVDYVETLELFRVATNGAYTAANNFVNILEQLYGMDPNSIMQAYGMFSQLANAIDMPTKSASQLSQGLTKVALDISSLFNVDFEDVITDLTAGMQGMVRSVRKYGIDIRNTTLQNIATGLGMEGQVSQMTEANRQGLRYLAMMGQLQRVNGNFSSTIESVANQLRILREQLSGVARAIGNLFMPALQGLIYKLVAVIMVIKMVLSFIGMLIGFIPQTFSKSTDNSTKSVNKLGKALGGAGGAASDAAKQMKYLMGFDELNVLNPPEDSGGGGGGGGRLLSDDLMDPALVAAIDSVTASMENYTMKAIKARDAMMNFLGFFSSDGNPFYIEFDWDTNKWKTNIIWSAKLLERNLIDRFPRWKKTIESVFDNAAPIWRSIKGLWDSIGTSIKLTFAPIKKFLDETFTDDAVSKWVDNLSENLDWLGGIFEKWAPTVGTIIAGVGETFRSVFQNIDFKGIIDALTRVVEKLGPFFDTLGEGFNGELGDIVAKVSDALIDFLNGVADALDKMDDQKIENFGKFIANLMVWLPIIAPIAQGLSSFSNGIMSLVQGVALLNMGGGTKGVLATLFGGGAATGTGMAGAAESTAIAVEGVGGAAASAAAPVAAIVAGILAIIGVCAYLIATTDSLKQEWSGTWEQITTAFTSQWEGGLKPGLSALWGYIVMLWDNALKPLFINILSIVIPILTSTIALLNIFIIGLNAIITAVVTVVGAIVLFVTWVIQLVDAINFATIAFADFIDAITSGNWSGGLDKLKSDLGSIWTGFSSSASKAASDFGKTTGDMWSQFGSTTSTEWDTAMKGLGISPTTKEILVADGNTAGRALLEGVEQGMSDGAEGGATGGAFTLGKIVNVDGMSADAITLGNNLSASVLTGMTETMSSASNPIAATFDSIDLSQSGTKLAKSFFASFESEVATIPSKVIRAFQPLPNMLTFSITNNMSAVWQQMANFMYNRAVVMVANVTKALTHIVVDAAEATGQAVALINKAFLAIPRIITITLKFSVDRLGGTFNNLPGFGESGSGGGGGLSVLHPEPFAEGGYPNKGQLFIANENGLEYFSKQSGGKTGIMNNDQMAQVIASAVYKATYDANMAANGNANDANMTVVLKASNRSIAQSAEDGKLSRGYKILTKGAT